MGKKRDLLMKDISSRLSYGIICRVKYIINNETTDGEDVESEVDDKIIAIDTEYNEVKTEWLNEWNSIDNIRPYLRPLSSMTEEEKDEYNYGLTYVDIPLTEDTACRLIDWLNKHMFDYRVLIEKGLVLEAPEGMYK